MLTINQSQKSSQSVDNQRFTPAEIQASKIAVSYTFSSPLNISGLGTGASRTFCYLSTKTLNKGSFNSRTRARRRERF